MDWIATDCAIYDEVAEVTAFTVYDEDANGIIVDPDRAVSSLLELIYKLDDVVLSVCIKLNSGPFTESMVISGMFGIGYMWLLMINIINMTFTLA